MFHPVIQLPERYPVYDFTKGILRLEDDPEPFGVGRYNEKRPAVYMAEQYVSGGKIRNIHVGIDLFAPVGTPVHAFAEGRLHLFGNNSLPQDYGYTLVTEHVLDGVPLYALHGHLNARSLEGKREGQSVSRGEVIAWVGDRHENGGWPAHLHFQLSYERPLKPDMPGAVAKEDLSEALLKYPDPRRVLGPLY